MTELSCDDNSKFYGPSSRSVWPERTGPGDRVDYFSGGKVATMEMINDIGNFADSIFSTFAAAILCVGSFYRLLWIRISWRRPFSEEISPPETTRHVEPRRPQVSPRVRTGRK
jgi:hypothetical protein